MPPAKVKNIISKTKENHATDGEESADELGKLERERERENLNTAECEDLSCGTNNPLPHDAQMESQSVEREMAGMEWE